MLVYDGDCGFCSRAVQVVDGVERVRVLSDAGLAAAVYLGGGWRLAGLIGLAVPRLIGDRVYTIVARYRKRVFGPADQSCLVIPASERSRFLPRSHRAGTPRCQRVSAS